MLLYRSVFFLVISLFLLSSCSDDSGTIDSGASQKTTLIKSLELSQYIIDTDTVSVIPGELKSPDDVVSIRMFIRAGVLYVSPSGQPAVLNCRITLDGSGQEISNTVLATIDASTYGGIVEFQIKRGDVGDYAVEVNGLDAKGQSINSTYSKFKIFYGLKPPVLSDLSCPDTIKSSSTDTLQIILSIRVNDPSGLKDVQYVYFNSYKPDGSPSPGNRFIMYDDGLGGHGDAVAGDGVFSKVIYMFPGAQKGRYRFEFFSIDYSNLVSNVVVKYIVVL
jgi:hypothetical protein